MRSLLFAIIDSMKQPTNLDKQKGYIAIYIILAAMAIAIVVSLVYWFYLEGLT